jgi:hypothetical protein
MSSQFTFINEDDFCTRARIEGEIHAHDVSLRKINDRRLQLAVRCAENNTLRRMIERRHRELCLRVDRVSSTKRASRGVAGLRQRRATH